MWKSITPNYKTRNPSQRDLLQVKILKMNRQIILLVLAVASQARSQALLDNFDPRVPRPGATLPASLDPYGFSRPLPPSVDPLGISYRPAHAGAVLPALYDPLGASRPGGLPFALDPIGYTRTTDGTWGGRGYSAYGGSFGAAYDNYLARPSGFITGVGGNPIFPDPNAPVPLYAGRVHGTYPPAPAIAMPVMPVSAVPVAPVASVAPVAPVSYSVPAVAAPVNPVPAYTAPAFPPALPFGNANAAPNLPLGGPLNFGNGGAAPNLPLGGPLNFGNGGVGPNLPAVPSGNLQIGSGGSTSSGLGNGNFMPPL